MRFSLLNVRLSDNPEETALPETGPIAAFIANHNVSCICVQGCRQTGLDRDGDLAPRVCFDLEKRGLKYQFVWRGSYRVGSDHEIGSAVLSQLPVLGRAAQCVTDSDDPTDPETRVVVAARLGVSPAVSVDVFNTGLATSPRVTARETERVFAFVESSAAELTPARAPRGRGRPPRIAPTRKWSDPVRMVFLAGGLMEDRDSFDFLRGRGFSYAGGDPVSTQLSVYLRPMLRPASMGERSDMRVGAGPRVEARLLEFEI